MTEQEFIELTIKAGYNLAKKECPKLKECPDLIDDKVQMKFVKKYIQLVHDVCTVLGEMRCRLSFKEESWESWIEKPENRTTKYVFEELDKMISEKENGIIRTCT